MIVVRSFWRNVRSCLVSIHHTFEVRHDSSYAGDHTKLCSVLCFLFDHVFMNVIASIAFIYHDNSTCLTLACLSIIWSYKNFFLLTFLLLPLSWTLPDLFLQGIYANSYFFDIADELLNFAFGASRASAGRLSRRF